MDLTTSDRETDEKWQIYHEIPAELIQINSLLLNVNTLTP